MSEWISIKDKQPKAEERVLVLFDGKHITIAEYIPKYKVLAEDYISEDCPDFFEEDGKTDNEWAPSGFYEFCFGSEINYYLHEKITHWQALPTIE